MSDKEIDKNISKKDEELEAVLKRLMLRVKHIESEPKFSEKKLTQSIKDFLARENF